MTTEEEEEEEGRRDETFLNGTSRSQTLAFLAHARRDADQRVQLHRRLCSRHDALCLHRAETELVPDLLVDAEGDFGPRAVEAGLAGGPEALAGARDGRVVEELLVDTLWVLVCQQVADGQLLVDEVGHGELLADELRRELRGQEPAVAQERGALGAQGGARVVLAGGVRQTLRRGVFPEATLDGQSSGAAQRAQMGGGGLAADVAEALLSVEGEHTWERGHSLASALWLFSLSSSLRAFLTVAWVHCSGGSCSSRAKLHEKTPCCYYTY
ncbi:hypothetical protein EYF80_019460 [Liparis tanakae]|uniref:Uncharacterized protein n=1 Tax=Liparis tanakae TaxID=230148 RepID=A0A4Z2HWL4_9TELE|nr:hypothetical protein EYF80_019460 [Liparis tanakae]